MMERHECASYNNFCYEYGKGPIRCGWQAGDLARNRNNLDIVADIESVDLELDLVQYRRFKLVPVEVVGTFSVPSAPPPAKVTSAKLAINCLVEHDRRLAALEAWAQGGAYRPPAGTPQTPLRLEDIKWD